MASRGARYSLQATEPRDSEEAMPATNTAAGPHDNGIEPRCVRNDARPETRLPKLPLALFQVNATALWVFTAAMCAAAIVNGLTPLNTSICVGLPFRMASRISG
jgi:hypothetical protein